MARALGVEQYGLLQYTLGLVAAFSSISFICGAEVLVPPLVTATPAERKRLLGNAFVLRQAASVVAYICLLIFAWVAEDRGNFYLIALIGSMMLWSESFIVTTVWLQAQTNIKPRSILSFISLTVKLLIVFTLYRNSEKRVFHYALAYLIDSLILSIGMMLIYKIKTGELFFEFNKNDAFNLLKKSIPFLIGLMAMSFYQRVDLIFLKHISRPHDVGIYAAAMQLVTPIAAIASMISFSLAPRYVYSQKDIVIAHKNVGKITVFMFAISVMIAALICVTGEFFIRFLFGEKFSDSASSFRYLIWIICPIFIDSALNIAFVQNQLGKFLAYKWIIALIISATAHILLIPNFRNFGAIAGCMIGYISVCIFDAITYVRTSRRINTIKV